MKNHRGAPHLRTFAYLAFGLCLALTACGEDQTTSDTQSPADAPPDSHSAPLLTDVLAGAHRSEKNRARDQSRHPIETLSFFGLEPDMTAVEIWPGGGWYTEVIAPYLNRGGGKFIAANWDPNTDVSYIAAGLKRYREKISDSDIYGDITITALGPNTPSMAPDNSADLIVTFRNLHNWLARGTQEAILAQVYKALKPGGVFGVIDHRAPTGATVDPQAKSGYVNEAYAIQIIEQAGFVLVESSPVNNNPKDTADHPFGVWTLPPTLKSAARGEETEESFDQDKYSEIGESDRFTLKFIKP